HRMVVVPHESGALIVRIVKLGFVRSGGRVQNRIVHETFATFTSRSPPGERTTVADPGNKASVKMSDNSILRQIGAGNGGIDGKDMRRRKIISKCDLYRRSSLGHDDATEMSATRWS